MKAEEKQERLKEVRLLFDSLDIPLLIDNPNNLQEIKKIHRIKAILTNFSFDVGVELQRLFQKFQRWARAKERREYIENCAADMMQYISLVIEEIDLKESQENEAVQNEINRRIKKLKTENLWFRTVREKNEDLHIIFGEKNSPNGAHVHFIVDSQTGEVRVDPEDEAPESLVEKIVAITIKDGGVLNIKDSTIETTLEFNKPTDSQSTDHSNNLVIPTLYVDKTIGKSGGPNGHFHYFKIKNINNDSNAFNVRWGIRGFNYEWQSRETTFDLLAGQERDVEFPLSGEKIFHEEVKDLNIFVEYQDLEQNIYFIRRTLNQQLVPSGAFYILQSDTYFAPTKLINDGLQMLGKPERTGSRIAALFEILYSGEKKEVTIAISDTLLSTWEMENYDDACHALVELAHRKIRQMVRNNELLSEYTFTTFDFPNTQKIGYEAYKEARENII